MELKPISRNGHFCEACIGLTMLICSSVVAGSTWWALYFWDCPGIDIAYYLVLKDGYCVDADEGKSEDYDDCTSWEDIQDLTTDSEVEDGAQAFIDSLGLSEAAIAFSLFFLIAAILPLIPAVAKFKNIIRFVSVGLGALCFFMFVGALGAASDNWFTDVENYYEYDVCGSYATFGFTGFWFALIGVIVALVSVATLLFPCCCCVGSAEDDAALSANKSDSTQANPVVQSTPA
jgi:hypothetical protein